MWSHPCLMICMSLYASSTVPTALTSWSLEGPQSTPLPQPGHDLLEVSPALYLSAAIILVRVKRGKQAVVSVFEMAFPLFNLDSLRETLKACCLAQRISGLDFALAAGY